MVRTNLTFDTVRSIGLSLPDVVESTSYGAPALKVRGELLACVPVNKSAEPNCVVVRFDLDQRAVLIRSHPAVFYITEHYANYPTVLVRLSRISSGDLRELLQLAHRYVLSRKGSRKAGAKSKRRAPK